MLKKRSLWCRVIFSTPTNGQDGSGERSRDTSRDVQTLGSTQFTEQPRPWASNQETSLTNAYVTDAPIY